jgi:hypothetical protein
VRLTSFVCSLTDADDAQAVRLDVGVLDALPQDKIVASLLQQVPEDRRA